MNFEAQIVFVSLKNVQGDFEIAPSHLGRKPLYCLYFGTIRPERRTQGRCSCQCGSCSAFEMPRRPSWPGLDETSMKANWQARVSAVRDLHVNQRDSRWHLFPVIMSLRINVTLNPCSKSGIVPPYSQAADLWFHPQASLAGAQTQCNSVSCCLIAWLTHARTHVGGTGPDEKHQDFILRGTWHCSSVHFLSVPLQHAFHFALLIPKCKTIILSGIRTFLLWSNFSQPLSFFLNVHIHIFLPPAPQSSPGTSHTRQQSS